MAIRDGVRLLILTLLITWLLPSASVPQFGLSPPALDSVERNPNTVEGGGETNTASEFNRTKVERYIWKHTNEERVERGLARVEYAPRIVEHARGHSRNMARHDYVGHTQPDGETAKERYSSVCRYPGENAISGWYGKPYEPWKTGEVIDTKNETKLARYLVKGWMNSEGHRENILRPRWNELGVGVYRRDDGKLFVSQTFC
jgi:uncharacterized protein YkwD